MNQEHKLDKMEEEWSLLELGLEMYIPSYQTKENG